MSEQTLPQQDDRRLLAEVSRWRRANGWTLSGQRGWVNARCGADATVAVDYSEHRDGFTIARRDDRARSWPLYPDFYPADSVRQVVDMLAALAVLPPRFSSAYGLAERYQEARRAWNLAESHSERIKVGHILDHLRDIAEGVTR